MGDMDKCRYVYTPDGIDVKMYDLAEAQKYCKEHRITNILVLFEGWDPKRSADGWYTENSLHINFLTDGTWEQADYAELRKGTNY